MLVPMATEIYYFPSLIKNLLSAETREKAFSKYLAKCDFIICGWRLFTTNFQGVINECSRMS